MKELTDKYPESHSKIGGLLKEAVFGFNDGLVSTFAIIAGLTGGLTEQRTILLAALATLFAGAFSMGLGTYLGSKSERDLYESEKKREQYEMEHMPETEKQEIRDIYTAKGFRGELLEKVVHQITSDKKVWLETMMSEELGFAQSPAKPSMNGVVMAISFFLGALIPTVSYFFKETSGNVGLPFLFKIALGLSILGLLLAGGLKTIVTKKNVFLSALETLLIGTLAAGGSYGIGVVLTS